MILSTRPNSHEAKILAPKYQEIIARVNDMQTPKTCTHIKISGVCCGSPALRQQEFCYYHQRMHRGVRTPPQARLHPIALIEDRESIQVALMEVLNGLMRNTIELKRAALMLRALHIAVKNAGHKDFASKPSQMVKEVPEYGELSVNDSAALRELDIPFEASFGQDPRYTRPERHYKTPEESARARGEKIANYYGFPTAEAHAAAKQKRLDPALPLYKDRCTRKRPQSRTRECPCTSGRPSPSRTRSCRGGRIRPPKRTGIFGPQRTHSTRTRHIRKSKSQTAADRERRETRNRTRSRAAPKHPNPRPKARLSKSEDQILPPRDFRKPLLCKRAKGGVSRQCLRPIVTRTTRRRTTTKVLGTRGIKSPFSQHARSERSAPI
jgi:hypothetical protein